MPDPTPELDARFSSPDAKPCPWPVVRDAMDEAEIFWISTVRSDGRPHVTPIPAIWLDGALHFCTGPREQKTVNLQGNDHTVLTTGNNRFREGLDIVVEGRAQRVRDRELLERLAAEWLRQLDWPFEVTDDGFRDPGPDGPEDDAHVYAVNPTKILAFTKGEPYTQTRYVFP